MEIRTTKPGAGNKYYIRKANGGYSNAITGSPTDGECNVLANCVGYAYGRFNEIGGYGYCKYLAPVNAENFITYKGSCEVTQTPSVGACMVWRKGDTLSGSDGAGHVAIVEKVNSSTQVFTSESGYGSSSPFWNSTRNKGNGNWGAGAGYTFLGFIKNPAIPDVPVDPYAGVSDEDLAARVWAGEFGNGDERKAKLGIRYNSVQALVNKGVGKPVPSTPVVPEPVVPTPEPVEQFPVGTRVKIVSTGNGSSYGDRNKAFGIGWTRYVTAIYADRPYPYQVGNQGRTDSANTTGFYQASALEKI